MEDEAPPPPPAPIVIAQPPTSSVTASDNALANVEASEQILDRGILPRYAQVQTDIMRAQAPQLAQINLEQQKTVGPQLIQAAIDQLKMADPTGFKIRETLGERTLASLQRGGALSDEELRARQQDIRAAQQARGVGTGLGDSIDEARYLGDQRYLREQQAKVDAASFLAGAPPQASFASLNQAGKVAPVGSQDVSGFASSLFPSTNALIANQAANYGTHAGFTSSMNSLNSANHWAGIDRVRNPFQENVMFGLGVAQGLGKIGGSIAGGVAGGGMCWVAEELFGKDHKKTHAIRAYCVNHFTDKSELGAFCRAYQFWGKAWAVLIKNSEHARSIAKKIWENLYQAAIKEGYAT